MHRGNRAGLAYAGSTVAFGEYGLMALERCWMDAKQIESARVAISRQMKRHGKLWIRIFPQKSFTKKPLETRMGTGKAEVDYWAARVRPGTVLFEIAGVPEATAKMALVRVAQKMPVQTRFVGRRVRV